MAGDDNNRDTLRSPPRVRSEGMLVPGAVVAGRYEIRRELGRGGMGVVYEALDRELSEGVALKLLDARIAASPQALERFRREVKLARRVTHPNVARTFELGLHEEHRFLTMELLAGKPLSSMMDQMRPMSVAEAAPIIIDVCGGLAAAHAAAVVHRDIKPDNVLVERDRAVITDFGIARTIDESHLRMTSSESPIGTPAYMAPEQIAGGEISTRSDLYALGAMMFEMFTGRLPFSAETPIATALERLVRPAPDVRSLAEVPEPIARAIDRCLRRDPAERPAAAGEIASVFEALRATPRSRAVEVPIAAAPPLVAILPFENRGLEEHTFVAAGLSRDLIDALSSVRSLRVLSSAATSRFKGADRDAPAIARELGAAYVVEGGLDREGSKLRLTERMLDAKSGAQLWAHTVEGAARDLFKQHDRSSVSIIRTLSPGEPTMEPRLAPPTDPAALDLFLRARHAYNEAFGIDVTRSVELLERARTIAPDDPLILAAQALVEVRRWFLENDPPLTRAREVMGRAEQAVAAAPQLGESHLALGVARFHSGDAAGASRALRNAISLSPSLAEAHATLGRILCEAGRAQDGLQRLRIAHALDPTLEVTRWEIIRTQALCGDWAPAVEALAAARSVGEQADLSPIRLSVWTRDRKSIEHWANEKDVPDALRYALQGYLASKPASELYEAADSAMPGEGASARRHCFVLQIAAEVSALMSDPSVAIEALVRADRYGLIDLLWLDGLPLFDDLRQRPDFERVRASVQRRVDAICDQIWG
jgi:serine/threonine-protein kinase